MYCKVVFVQIATRDTNIQANPKITQSMIFEYLINRQFNVLVQVQVSHVNNYEIFEFKWNATNNAY